MAHTLTKTIQFVALVGIAALLWWACSKTEPIPTNPTPPPATTDGTTLPGTGQNNTTTGTGISDTTAATTIVGVNTASGISDLTTTIGENVTETGVNPTPDSSAVVVGEAEEPNEDDIYTIEPEAPKCDTVYIGRQGKPFFYSDFDTSKKENEIRLFKRSYYFTNNENERYACGLQGQNVLIIASEEEYNSRCKYYINTSTGTGKEWVLTTLPSFDFSKQSLFYIIHTRSTQLFDYYTSKLLYVSGEYHYIKYMGYKGNACGFLLFDAFSESAYVVDKPLIKGAKLKEIDIIRAKCYLKTDQCIKQDTIWTLLGKELIIK